MISKIQDRHRQKPAYVYIRQSTIAQVRHHQESTERQYALKNKALDLGWSPAAIRILDGDLGKSASRISGRKDFKTLVADVSDGPGWRSICPGGITTGAFVPGLAAICWNCAR